MFFPILEGALGDEVVAVLAIEACSHFAPAILGRTCLGTSLKLSLGLVWTLPKSPCRESQELLMSDSLFFIGHGGRFVHPSFFFFFFILLVHHLCLQSMCDSLA